MHDFDSARIAVIGLGYVGLPLAVEFAKHFSVVGFERNSQWTDVLGRYLKFIFPESQADLCMKATLKLHLERI